jgi:hypothetical protein
MMVGMPPTPVSPASGTTATTLDFAAAARALGHEARRLGLVVPGFRSPPLLVGANRSVRRRVPTGAGATVAVRVRGRPIAAVVADMVEGVVVANRLVGPPADQCRHALWAAAGLTVPGIGRAA